MATKKTVEAKASGKKAPVKAAKTKTKVGTAAKSRTGKKTEVQAS